jgi:hypothetical protein
MCNSGREVCQFVPSLVFVLVCCQPSSSAIPPGDAENAKQLKKLVIELRKTDDTTKQVDVRRRIYALGRPGHHFLVDGVADPFWHRRIVTAVEGSSFHVVFSGLRYRFVDERDGQERTLDDISFVMNQRLLNNGKYLDRFIKSWSPGNGIDMEECVDELSDPRSTPASRKIAHRYLEVYEELHLVYDPTRPVCDMPENIRRRLADWKRDHYWGSFWEMVDESSPSGCLPLKITAKDVPVPEAIPWTTPEDVALFKEYHAYGYLRAANGHVNGLRVRRAPGEDNEVVDAALDAGVRDGNAAKLRAFQTRLYGPRPE